VFTSIKGAIGAREFTLSSPPLDRRARPSGSIRVTPNSIERDEARQRLRDEDAKDQRRERQPERFAENATEHALTCGVELPSPELASKYPARS
jgi:hypothetical protein